MGKMEAAGEVVRNLAQSGWTGTQETSSLSIEQRKAEIRRQLNRIFLSANQERPGPERMTLLTEDAARLWKDIPTESLHGAVEAAIIEAGSFPATNGLVAKLWAGRKPKEAIADYAAIGRRDQEAERRYLAAPDNRPPTDEERAANAAMMAEIARKLKGL